MSEVNTIFKGPSGVSHNSVFTDNSSKTAKIEKLRKKLDELKLEHKKLRDELGGSNNEDGNFDIKVYEKETKIHIQQLKKYNELKDLSMKLIQMIADSRQETLKTIMDEMGIENEK